MKAWKSILDQIDSFKVVEEAGRRKKPDIYRNVFKTIVHFHIEEQLKQKEYGKVTKIVFDKQDDEDTDTESGNDSSEDDGGDGFRHLRDNTFLESDETGTGYGSEDHPTWRSQS